MSRSQCLFLLITISIGLVQSWDVALTVGDQLEFYSNQTEIGSVRAQFRDLTALAYDAVNNMLLFVDKQSDNASIFSYHLATKKYQSLVRRKSSESIQGVAFDPVKGLLFWTDTIERSIFFMSLKHRSENDIYGTLLFKMGDEIPRAIAVDSCRGYIYWTNVNITKATIERARFDGTERTVIVDTNMYMPVSLTIDQQTKRLYWTDDKEGIYFSIESSDLNGKDRTTLLLDTQHTPNSMTVSNDSIFWVDLAYRTVWTIPKIPTNDIKPKEYIVFKNEEPFGIVANYKIEDQIVKASECEALVHMMENRTTINDTFSLPPDVDLFCVHGIKVVGKLACKCKAGYTGDRCDVSVCINYCHNGHCSLTDEGEPICSCDKRFAGGRCETNLCYNYCLNNGICETNDKHEPACSCSKDFEGLRCENVKPISTPKPLPTTVRTTEETQSLPETEVTCNCNEGLAGKRCEIDLCYNYCLNNGICETNDKREPVCSCSKDFEGLRCENVKPIFTPKPLPTTVRTTEETQSLPQTEAACNCNEGLAGKKCETEMCFNYCLNNGTCKINEKHEPVCSCSRNYEGLRCENVKPISAPKPLLTTVMATEETQSLPETEVCNCTKEENAVVKIASPLNSVNSNNDDFVEASSCNDGWNTFSHPVFMVLGITCGLLCVACVVLITKIMQLKKRPRIKRRIIVNKNVTPMTARPDQCEITIENCCNMNICETPCFEPRSTIRPTLIDSKPGKEEKKNLISNMECPDDY